MLSSSAASARRAKAIATLHCSTASDKGTIEVLQQAAEGLLSAKGELLGFVANALRAIATSAQKIWNQCSSETDCKLHLHCKRQSPRSELGWRA
jgi:Mrp family chromosome partitioning ATPase